MMSLFVNKKKKTVVDYAHNNSINFLLVLSFLSQGCHGQVKVRQKRKFFQGQGKVREFFKKSGKIFDIGKVSEKSGNSVFRFIANKFSARFSIHFQTKCTLQSKETDQFDTRRLNTEMCSGTY